MIVFAEINYYLLNDYLPSHLSFRRCLLSILADYYTPDIISDPKYKMSPSGIYYAPPKGNYNDYIDFIKVGMRFLCYTSRLGDLANFGKYLASKSTKNREKTLKFPTMTCFAKDNKVP